MNLIAVQHLDPDRYQKLFDGYKVSLLGWSSKNFEAIVMDLVYIYHHIEIVKTSPSTARVAVNSVTRCRW